MAYYKNFNVKENHLMQVKLSDKIGFFQTTYSSFE